jgi:hypothetical protein
MFLVHNERTRLTASWFNALAAGVIAAGFFGPMAALVYQIVPLTVGTAYVITIAFGCLVFGGVLHLVGLAFLRRLRA